jgi:hypothetical protein
LREVRGSMSLGFLAWIGLCWSRLRRSRHSDAGEQVKNLVVGDEVCTLGVQADEMRAELSVVAADAVVDAKQIRVGAVYALSKGDADLGDCDPTSDTDRKKVFALNIVRATGKGTAIFNIPENPAAVEEVRVMTRVSLDLREALIDPIDAVSAINHVLSVTPFSCAPPIRAC